MTGCERWQIPRLSQKVDFKRDLETPNKNKGSESGALTYGFHANHVIAKFPI